MVGLISINQQIAYITEGLLLEAMNDVNQDYFKEAEEKINKSIKQLSIVKFEIKKLQALIYKVKLKRSE